MVRTKKIHLNNVIKKAIIRFKMSKLGRSIDNTEFPEALHNHLKIKFPDIKTKHVQRWTTIHKWIMDPQIRLPSKWGKNLMKQMDIKPGPGTARPKRLDKVEPTDSDSDAVSSYCSESSNPSTEIDEDSSSQSGSGEEVEVDNVSNNDVQIENRREDEEANASSSSPKFQPPLPPQESASATIPPEKTSGVDLEIFDADVMMMMSKHVVDRLARLGTCFKVIYVLNNDSKNAEISYREAMLRARSVKMVFKSCVAELETLVAPPSPEQLLKWTMKKTQAEIKKEAEDKDTEDDSG